MNDEIIKLREKIVELSSDKYETKNLLDQLTEEVVTESNILSPFHVGKNDIIGVKDCEHYKVYKLSSGWLVHYLGGYNILIDEKMRNAAGAAELIYDGVPETITDENEREGLEIAISAAEMVFRLPMFVFSHPQTTYNIATLGVQYLLLLQKMGEVPTEETSNPEYDKFIIQMNEMMENFAAGIEKEGKEYERRNGIIHMSNGEEKENQGEGQN